MDTIQKPSRRFEILFRFLFFAYPVFLLVTWLAMTFKGADPNPVLDFSLNIQNLNIQHEPVLWQRLACFGATMLPGAALMYIFHSLYRLFGYYGKGMIFCRENVKCYRSTALGLIIMQILHFPEDALISLILTATNPKGQHVISFGMNDTNITMIVAGIMILVISRIMDQGRKLQEEQALTV